MAKHNSRLNIKNKHLIVQEKQDYVPNSDTKSLVPKMPRSQQVHMLDWLGTELLWLSSGKSKDLRY